MTYVQILFVKPFGFCYNIGNIVHEELKFYHRRCRINSPVHHWIVSRDGNGEGTNFPVPIPDILCMSPSPSELLKRIFIPSPNNNRGSPRVPDPRITNTFFCFRFWVNYIKIKNSNKSKVRNISYINIDPLQKSHTLN